MGMVVRQRVTPVSNECSPVGVPGNTVDCCFRLLPRNIAVAKYEPYAIGLMYL